MLKNFFINLIEIWQVYFSRDHSYWKTEKTKRICNLYPSCSAYTKKQIQDFGIIKGIFLGYKRLKLCKKASKK